MRQGSASSLIAPDTLAVRRRGGERATPEGTAFVLDEVAVMPGGRPYGSTPLASSWAPQKEGAPRIPLLCHAGPAAMATASERGVGPEDVATPFGGRRAQALDADGWQAVVTAFGAAAEQCVSAGASAVVINAEADSLLGAVLSPRYAPGWTDARRFELLTTVLERVRQVVERVGLLLVVEECAPAGLDASGGVRAAQVAVEAGADWLIASSRSAWFEMRGAELGVLQDLASAAWLPSRVSVPVLVQVPARAARADLANVVARAKASGIDGVVLVEEEPGA